MIQIPANVSNSPRRIAKAQLSTEPNDGAPPANISLIRFDYWRTVAIDHQRPNKKQPWACYRQANLVVN